MVNKIICLVKKIFVSSIIYYVTWLFFGLKCLKINNYNNYNFKFVLFYGYIS